MVGRVHPGAVITNAGGVPGDLLVLTKPLGLGIITTASKQGVDRLGAIKDAIVVMTTLNRDASRCVADAGAHALTDVTGFGLLGHLRNLVAASGVSATIWSDFVPILSPAREYVEQGIAQGVLMQIVGSFPTGSATNQTLPRLSNSSSAMRKPQEDCSPPCPATKPPRLCGRSMRMEQARPL